jgi:hypothetical protein
MESTGLNKTVTIVSFYINGTERAGRAEVFTSSTTDATFGVDRRNSDGIGVFRIGRDHLDGTNRTVAGAIAAPYAFGCGQTVFLDPDRPAHLDG